MLVRQSFCTSESGLSTNKLLNAKMRSIFIETGRINESYLFTAIIKRKRI